MNLSIFKKYINFYVHIYIYICIYIYIQLHISTMHSICICNMSPHHVSTTISGWAFPIRLFEGGWGALMEGSSKRLPVWGPTPSLQSKGEKFLEAPWSWPVTWDFLLGQISPKKSCRIYKILPIPHQNELGGGLACWVICGSFICWAEEDPVMQVPHPTSNPPPFFFGSKSGEVPNMFGCDLEYVFPI